MRELTYFWIFWFGLVFFSLFTVHTVKAQDMLYDTAKDDCWDLIRSQYPTKRIYLNTHDRIAGTKDSRYFMSGRCFEPACQNPFSWFVYQVRYIEGRKAYITCTMSDNGEPKLDRYNDTNRFMPPE